jgi:shikimate kinase
VVAAFFCIIVPPEFMQISVNNICNISMSRYFLIGYMGSGKTTYGRLMAKELDLTFIDLDVYIESEERKSIDQIFMEIGEDGFRLIEKKALRSVSEIENVIIATGGGTPCFFDNMEFMNSKGKTIYLRTSVRELRDRLKMSKTKRPLISGKDLRELEDFIAVNLEKREPFYLKAKYILDTDDLNPNNLKSSFTELLEP